MVAGGQRMKIGWPDPFTVAMVAVSAVTYALIVLRQGWRWWLGCAACVVVLAAILWIWAVRLNAQSFFGGIVHAATAMMLVVGLGFGSVVQAIGHLRPIGRTVAFRGWGLVATVAAITAFIFVLG